MRLIYFVLASALLLTACSKKDDTPTPDTAALLIGTWNHTSDTYIEYKNGVLVPGGAPILGEGLYGDSQIQFNADHTGMAVPPDPSETETLIYMLTNGNKLAIFGSLRVANSVAIFQISETTTITKIDDNQLILTSTGKDQNSADTYTWTQVDTYARKK